MSPLLYVVPLQLLAHYTAVARGTDVDKPRNLVNGNNEGTVASGPIKSQDCKKTGNLTKSRLGYGEWRLATTVQ